MTREQFHRLSAVFWKTATPTELEASYTEYREALGALPRPALDSAVARAVRECSRMPLPSQLRAWALEAMPHTTRRRLAPGDGCDFCGGRAARRLHPTTGQPWRYALKHASDCRLFDAAQMWYDDAPPLLSAGNG